VLLEVLEVVSCPTVVVVVEDVVVVVGSSVVEVGRWVVVVVGLAVEALAVGWVRGLGRVVAEVPATRPRGRRVVGATAPSAGTSCSASPAGPGAVTYPSALPPTAPSTTATTSVIHRRSSLNRIHAPACASGFQ
jgi:hypothetical protein